MKRSGVKKVTRSLAIMRGIWRRNILRSISLSLHCESGACWNLRTANKTENRAHSAEKGAETNHSEVSRFIENAPAIVVCGSPLFCVGLPTRCCAWVSRPRTFPSAGLQVSACMRRVVGDLAGRRLWLGRRPAATFGPVDQPQHLDRPQQINACRILQNIQNQQVRYLNPLDSYT